MLADPNFVYKLLIEQTVGLGLVMSGTIAARGKDLLKELDFFLTDCTVGKLFSILKKCRPSTCELNCFRQDLL